MGAKDSEEIIELTDVVTEGDAQKFSGTAGGDFPPEQAIDPKALEDEFEQLLQGSQDTITGSPLDDDLDIESLFDELEDSNLSTDTEADASLDEEMEDIAAETPPSKDQELPGLDDLFNSLEGSDDPGEPQKDPADTEASSSKNDDLFDAFEELSDPLEPEEPADPKSSLPELEDLFEELAVEQEPAVTTPPEENSSLADEFPAAHTLPETQDIPEIQETLDTQKTLDVQETLITEKPAPAAIKDKDQSLPPDTGMADLEARIALLESRPAEPDTETLFALIAEFLEKNDTGTALIAKITAQISKEVKETTETMIDEKLATLNVLSSEEITAMVKEEIASATNEDTVEPPDTETLIAEITKDVQEKTQEGMDSWEKERVALNTKITALEEAHEHLKVDIQEQLEDIKAKTATQNDLDTVKASIDETMARQLPAMVQNTARTIMEEKMTSMIKDEIHAAVKENMPAPPDTEAIVSKIRSDLQNNVQEGMNAWEQERATLQKSINALQAPHDVKGTDIHDQIAELKADAVTKSDLNAFKTELDKTIEREIPAAAARIIREEITALLKK